MEQLNLKRLEEFYKDFSDTGYAKEYTYARFRKANLLTAMLTGIDDHTSWNLLDVGCGTGEILSIIQPKRYWGVELREETLTYAALKRLTPLYNFSSEFPKKNDWTVAYLLGTINYKYHEDVDFCKYEAKRLIHSAYNKLIKGGALLFTLNKTGIVEEKPILTWTLFEVINFLFTINYTLNNIILDTTFNNEYIIGIKKQ